MIAGVIAGLLGETVFSVVDENTATTFSRILSGVFLLALGIYLAGWTQSLAPIEKAGNRIWQYIKPLGSRFLPIRSYHQAFFSGLVWGWLPCGLVYSALVWALSSGRALDGALIMLVFGLSTLPALFLTGLSVARFGKLTRNAWLRRGIGLVLVIDGPGSPGRTFNLLLTAYRTVLPVADLAILASNKCGKGSMHHEIENINRAG